MVRRDDAASSSRRRDPGLDRVAEDALDLLGDVEDVVFMGQVRPDAIPRAPEGREAAPSSSKKRAVGLFEKTEEAIKPSRRGDKEARRGDKGEEMKSEEPRREKAMKKRRSFQNQVSSAISKGNVMTPLVTKMGSF